MKLTAPFPYFGGKSRVAPQIWRAFGTPDNYVEPFFGSGAVLLGRPGGAGKIETVNDADGLLVNVWRAIASAPDEVAAHADWPVSEADLHARHLELVHVRAEVTERLTSDPGWCDPRLAGWWVWGACCWIGSGWCSGDGPWRLVDGTLTDVRKLPHLGDAGRGINRKLPHLGDAGRGINRKLPHLGDAGQGINRQLPHLGNAGQGINDWMHALAARLRRVRITCGDWTRVLTDSVTVRHGTTAVLLDPPYDEGNYTYGQVTGNTGIAAQAAEWAAENGDRIRIAYCGYEDGAASNLLDGWRTHRWSGAGYGGGAGGAGDVNRARETVWFSPACVGDDLTLFEVAS